jgi:predicted ArsR family transcriptional regulator
MDRTTNGHGTRRTRRAILELLAESPAGMTAAELGRALGMHPNGVRKHLEALARDGSVGAERVVSGRRGRPAVRYRVADERRDAAAAQRLAALLAELVAEMGPDEALVEEFGRRQATRFAATPDGRAALMHMLTTMGFAPRETTGAAAWRDGGLEVVLGNCPFAQAVREEDGRLVCVLHRGLSRGLVELDPGARLTGFVAEPPDRGGCRIAAEGLAPRPAA